MRLATVSGLVIALLTIVLLARGTPSERASAVDFEVGGIQGTVLWDGAPIESKLTNAPCALRVRADNYMDVASDGTFLFPSLPADANYDLVVGSSQDFTILTGPNVTVVGGATVTQDIDLTSSFSLVTGVVEVSGVPPASPYLDINYGGLCQVGAADGSFAFLLPPGDYGVAVRSAAQQCADASFTFTAGPAGTTTALGTVAALPITGCPNATVSGQLLFNGAPYQPVGASTGSCGAEVRVDNTAIQLQADGSFQGTANVANGSKQLSLYFPTWSAAYATVWLVNGLTTTVDFETNGIAGLVTGSITVNGTPLNGGRLQIRDDLFNILDECTHTDSNGDFSIILLTDQVLDFTYSATVYASDNSFIGSFTIQAIDPGDTLALGTMDFQAATLQGTVLWGGSPVSTLLGDAPCGLQVYAGGNATKTIASDGSYYFPALTTGERTLLIRSSQNFTLFDGPTVNLTQGVTVQDIDLTSAFSLVTGVVEVSGAPYASPYLDINYGGLCQVGAADGSFAFLLPPGDYGVAVRSAAQQCADASFTFTAGPAGTTTALGTVAALPITGCPNATVSGQLLFNGAPYQPVGASTGSCGAEVRVDNTAIQLQADGSFQGTANVANGSKQLSLYFPTWSAAYATVWLVNGLTTTVDFETNGIAGLVTGSITVNGTPLNGGRLQIRDDLFNILDECTHTDSNGDFSIILLTDQVLDFTYSATVYASDNSFIGSFTIQDIDPGDTILYATASGTTSSGSQVEQELQGVAITFEVVTSEGTTTVTFTSVGPPPPPGVEPGSEPVNYQVSTTAGVEGTTEICASYDPETIGAEDDLVLLHWVDDAWVNVTTFVDNVNHLVCGEVTSFSPFLVAPLQSDVDSDGDGCTNGQEAGPDETIGGQRDFLNPWDFYDVLGPGAALPTDGIIDLPNDILGVIQHFAPLGTEPEYDVQFDRGPSAGPNPWNMTAPDGVIDLPNDILGVIQQFNHSCQ